MKVLRRPWRAVTVLAAVLALTAGGLAVANADAASTTCKNVSVPVTVGGSDGVIAGTLCAPPDATTMQVLVHGLTYNRHYWDSSYKPEKHSYAAAANKAGYATLAIDALGSGESLRPLSLFATLQADARTVHEVIKAVRKGEFGDYDKVMTVGHSAGALATAAEAGTYDDVDAMIQTGYSHSVNAATAFPTIVGSEYLASGDPEFADQIQDPLYLTSIPGARYALYQEGNYDEGMLATDEEDMRDAYSLVTVASAVINLVNNPNGDNNMPVLTVNGDKEPFFCGAATADCTTSKNIAKFEKKFYAKDAIVEGYAVKGTGHLLNLERTAPESTKRMIEFADKYVGAGDATTDAPRGPVPAPVEHEQSRPPLLARVANKAFSEVVLRVTQKYADSIEPLPGLGDAGDPIPLVADLRSELAVIIGDHLEGLPQDLLDGK